MNRAFIRSEQSFPVPYVSPSLSKLSFPSFSILSSYKGYKDINIFFMTIRGNRATELVVNKLIVENKLHVCKYTSRPGFSCAILLCTRTATFNYISVMLVLAYLI